MIDKFMYDYENKSNLEKYDIRFSKSYVKDFILYTLFTLIKPEGKTMRLSRFYWVRDKIINRQRC